jgi:hypothetical protein
MKMKNLLLAALAAVALVGTAQAGGVLRNSQLAWRFPANVTTAPFTQPTKALAAGGTDTTIWVGTSGWYMPDINSTDTVIVARFIVAIDSTAAYAPGQTTLTAVLDGATQSTANGLVNVNFGTVSLTLTPTTGDKVMSVPVFIAGVNQTGSNIGGWSAIPPLVRLRLSSSAAINAASVHLQYVSPQ